MTNERRPHIRPGLYKHYKGKGRDYLYRVYGVMTFARPGELARHTLSPYGGKAIRSGDEDKPLTEREYVQVYCQEDGELVFLEPHLKEHSYVVYQPERNQVLTFRALEEFTGKTETGVQRFTYVE